MNELLKNKLQEAGMTNAQLAQSSGIDEMRIYNFKRGRFLPNVDEAHKIGAVLHTDPRELFPDLKKINETEEVKK